MALSKEARARLEAAMSRRKAAKELADAIDAQAAPVANIADPSSATAEDCANKLNELMAALRAAGMLAE